MPDTQSGSDQASRLWLLIAALGLTGLAVTTYLTSNAIAHSEVSCSIDGCNTVLASKWSKILGIPVSAFGMATYAAIMLGALHAYQSPIDDLRGRLIVVGVSGVGVLASIYLTMAAKAHAFLRHRGYVIPEDIKAIGLDVLRHRVILTYQAEAESLASEDIVRRIFDRIDVP